MTIEGHKTESYETKTVTLNGPVYRALNEGKLNYRCAVPDLYLKPGDTVNADGDTFTAGDVVLTVGVASKTMEVQEA